MGEEAAARVRTGFEVRPAGPGSGRQRSGGSERTRGGVRDGGRGGCGGEGGGAGNLCQSPPVCAAAQRGGG